MAWVFLAIAIATELVGTLGLRATADRLTPWVVLLIVLAYAGSFFFMALALKQLNVGAVYAIWSAVGMAAVALFGVAFFGESLNARAVIGLVIIVIGVLVLVGSGSVRHS